MHTPWLAAYHAERDRILLARVRVCALITAGGVTLAGVVFWTSGTPLDSERLSHILLYGAVAIAAWGGTEARGAERIALPLAVAYVLAIAVAVTVNAWSRPSGIEFASQVFLTILMGAMMLLPWGTVPQLFVSVVVIALYAAVLRRALALPDLAVVFMVALAVPLSSVGAGLLERYRAMLFGRAWRQAQLLALARDLAHEPAPERVVARVLEHGMRLLGADSGIVALAGAPRTLRVEAVGGRLAGDPPGLVGLCLHELALGPIAGRDVFAVPDDSDGGPPPPVLDTLGCRGLVAATMRRGMDRIGVVMFGREGGEPFRGSAHELARGIADQAALALHTAHQMADLRRVSQMKSEFVSTMSHELRTPLNVILGFTEIAGDDDAAEADRREALARIDRAGRELLQLIESTLDVARLESGRDEPQLERLPLPVLWQTLRAACADFPRPPGVALEWADGVPPVDLVTDPQKLVVMVRNLVGNALKFTATGRVRVEASLTSDGVVLRVADTGIGIAPEQQEAVFEMFRQADGSDSRRYGGTGLGLYIVRRFAEQLGGSIDLDSVPGRGSTFTIRLPDGRPRAAVH